MNSKPLRLADQTTEFLREAKLKKEE